MLNACLKLYFWGAALSSIGRISALGGVADTGPSTGSGHWPRLRPAGV
jgi:hypothetical protein